MNQSFSAMEPPLNLMNRNLSAYFYAWSVLILIGLYVLFNQGFQQVRVPIFQWGGFPIGELFLLMSVFFINHKKTIQLLHETRIIYPLVMWGLYGMIVTLLNFREHGFWALRDANHVMELGFLYVGFAIFCSYSIVYENRKALVSLSVIILVFLSSYMYKDYLTVFSPMINTVVGIDKPLLVSYSGLINHSIWIAAVYLIYPSKKYLWKILISSLFVFVTLSIYQSRVSFLSIVAIFLTLSILSFRRSMLWLGAVAAAIMYIAVIDIADLRMEGRRGDVNLRMLGQLLRSTNQSGAALGTVLAGKTDTGELTSGLEKAPPGKRASQPQEKKKNRPPRKIAKRNLQPRSEEFANQSGPALGTVPAGKTDTGELTSVLEKASSSNSRKIGKRNLQSRSEKFAHPGWRKVRTLIFSDVAKAPDGTRTADKLVEHADIGTHYIRDEYPPPDESKNYTASYFVKAAGRSWVYIYLKANNVKHGRVYFNLSQGVRGTRDSFIKSASISKLKDGWYRISAAIQLEAGAEFPFFGVGVAKANKVPHYTGDGASGILLWGAQVETGELSPYQRTEHVTIEGLLWSGAARGSKERLLWWADIWEESIKDWRVVLFGIGPGPRIGTKIYIAGPGYSRSPHNSIVATYGRFGVVGLLLFLGLHVLILWKLVRGAQQSAALGNRYGQFIILSVILFMAVIWSFAMVQDGFEAPYTAIPFYFLMGLGLAVAAKNTKQTI